MMYVQHISEKIQILLTTHSNLNMSNKAILEKGNPIFNLRPEELGLSIWMPSNNEPLHDCSCPFRLSLCYFLHHFKA